MMAVDVQARHSAKTLLRLAPLLVGVGVEVEVVVSADVVVVVPAPSAFAVVVVVVVVGTSFRRTVVLPTATL